MSALPLGVHGLASDPANPTMTEADLPDAFPEDEPEGVRAWCMLLRNMRAVEPEDAAARAAVEGVRFIRPSTKRGRH